MSVGDAQQLMALSYTQPTVTTTGAWSSAQPVGEQIMKMQEHAWRLQIQDNQIVAGPSPQGVKKPMARLIRYTVVDPDAILADKKPEASILLSGTVMLNGTDDKGFLMDLAPRVAEKLAEHNAAREGVEYEDAEGKSKKLKAIKLSNLDVVVEQLKAY